MWELFLQFSLYFFPFFSPFCFLFSLFPACRATLFLCIISFLQFTCSSVWTTLAVHMRKCVDNTCSSHATVCRQHLQFTCDSVWTTLVHKFHILCRILNGTSFFLGLILFLFGSAITLNSATFITIIVCFSKGMS